MKPILTPGKWLSHGEKWEKGPYHKKTPARDFKTYIFGIVLQFPIDWLKRDFGTFFSYKASLWDPCVTEMFLFPWKLRESLEPPWMVSKKGKGPTVNTCIYIWMSLVHIKGYSLFLSHTGILSKSSDPFPLTGWFSGNRSELSLKCPFIHEWFIFLLLNRDLIQSYLFASFKCFHWDLDLSQEWWKWFMIQSLLSDPIWWTWLDDSAVETPITRYKKMVPKSSDFKEAGGSLTLGNLFFGLWHMTVLVQYSFRSHMCANVLSINYNFGFHDSLSFVVPVIEYVSMVVNKESIINFPTFKWRNDQGINRFFFRPR